MAVRIGNPDFSTVKGYPELEGDNSTINSTINVKEGKIFSLGDNGYAFCMIAERVTDISNSQDFKPGMPLCWIAHAKEYQRYSYKEKQRVAIQPTLLERTVLNWIDGDGANWKEKSFKGMLSLNGAESVLNAVTQGKLWQILFSFEECETELIKDLTTNSGGGKRTGSTGQTEAQKLLERQAFMIAASGVHGEGCNNLAELSLGLTKMKADFPDAYEAFVSLLGFATGK